MAFLFIPLATVVFPLANLLKRKMLVTPGIVIACFLAFSVFLLRPVCAPIGDQGLKRFNPPIEERQDRDFTMRIFQERDGQNGDEKWHQCKTWVSRFFFF
ncbi:MAG: hypothetical protein IIA36_05155 [Proteobacteria bacterium]|nr:hypothetical protein [Pseudomonadota bacterium]